jgi:2-dehydro-3-deoxy-D-arabinonate dehydratase
MKIRRRGDGVSIVTEGRVYRAPARFSIDELFRQSEPADWLRSALATLPPAGEPDARDEAFLPPLESQEVWAAGVTYRRSREARMEESEQEADVYDRVYRAERPELFFKATAARVVGHGGEVGIRSDSDWNVPEAELALAISSQGRVFGYSVGNDMSSRSIEGENPLYLPQAKIYDGSCALGPSLLVADEPLPSSTEIAIRVGRRGAVAFEGRTRLSEMKRRPSELASYLFRDNTFPNGCYLLTGTGIVPESDFTLAPGDEIAITIEPIGTLINRVRPRSSR